MKKGNTSQLRSSGLSPASRTRKREGPPIETGNYTKRKRTISVETETRIDISWKKVDARNQDLPTSSRAPFSQNPIKSERKRRKRKTKYFEYGRRKWVFASCDSSRFKDKVVIVSYNILGVENAVKHPDLYAQVPPKCLDWDWRKKLICKELNHYVPGILCFQEVDRFSDLAELLQKDGFKGVYKARTGDACDGCAIFWKEELFTLLYQENIEFRKFGLRDNVAQFCVFKMNQRNSNTLINGASAQVLETAPCRSFLVGNIHMLFNPNRGDVKLGQIRLFLEKAHAISLEWGSIPVVVAGDLNSTPQSAIYQFLASSELDILQFDRRKISGQFEYPLRWRPFRSHNEDVDRFQMSISRPLMYQWSEEEIRLATGSEEITNLQHRLKLCSAYKGVPGSSSTRDDYGEPLATSYHSKFLGTVDYIWHSEALFPVRVVETLPVNILRETGGLPSEKWGSDHLALVSELAFIDDNDRS